MKDSIIEDLSDEQLTDYSAKSIGLVLDASTPWNPLSDNADAFVLSIRLKLPIWYCKWPSGATYVAAQKLWSSTHGMYEDDGVALGDDPSASVRRAIVRAAAYIGKKKEIALQSLNVKR